MPCFRLRSSFDSAMVDPHKPPLPVSQTRLPFSHTRLFLFPLFLLILIAITTYPMIIETHLSLLYPSLSQPGRTLLQELKNHSLSFGADSLHSGKDSFSAVLSPLKEAPSSEQVEQSTTIRLPSRLFSPKYTSFVPDFLRSVENWVMAKRYQPQIMQSLLAMVKGPIDRHYISTGMDNVALGQPYKTCAVVGNSGILLNRSYARFIDSHETVIRLNNARTLGFQDRVGAKTTIAFINSNILQRCARSAKCFCHPYGENVPIVVYLCQLVHLMEVTYCSASQSAPIIVTDPRFDSLCMRIVKHYSLKGFVESSGKRLEEWSDAHDGPMFHYSSGMQAVMLALGICEKVSIFGFGKAPGMKHHYHTNQRGELGLHDYSAEYRFYDDLVHNRSSLIPFLSDARFSVPAVEIYL